jgi:hypothetical protein
MRKAVGRFGITGKAQTQPILQLSDGLRSRLVFAWLAYKTPHILALVSYSSTVHACPRRNLAWTFISLNSRWQPILQLSDCLRSR